MTIAEAIREYVNETEGLEFYEQEPETKNLAVREWICAKCKTSHDRDRNAAINIW